MADSTRVKPNPQSPMFDSRMMEVVCERRNMQEALKRVQRNRGAAGVDGMTVEELPAYLREHWIQIREELLCGSYRPQPVRRVEIPKPGRKEKRKLGIPCVVDRLIQQAFLQVMQKSWDRRFSNASYGFRPGRSAHQAVRSAQGFLHQGYRWVVDLDLEKFYDRVHHDRLMSHLAREIEDKRVLRVLRSFLNAGILEDGLVGRTEEGVPQGSPLSPLLSNIVLDELDRELETRGHKFVRYGDDCNIYVKSERAGQRVMKSVSCFITRRLKLKVNEQKSGVDLPQKRKFLGFSFTGGKQPNRRKIAPESLNRFKHRIRGLTNRNHSVSLEERIARLSKYIRGWRAYFGFCETPRVLQDLDSWIRRRLRCAVWKQWKVYRRRKCELIRLGVRRDLAQSTAWSSKGPWNLCHTPGVRMALSNAFFDSLGLPRLKLENI